MGLFFPDQRWTSEGEPELGVGIVTEISKGRVKIHFPIADETRLYATDNTPLRRVVFKAGDTIVDLEKRPLLIERVQQNGDLIIYIGQDRALSEAELGDVSVTHDVDDRLAMGEVDTPQLFALRRQTLQYDHNRRISPINGFVGGRIDLIPHQLYIAHEVSSRYAPRVLLSDEVGLGKTIEACLVLHRLLVSGRISRVLILVPESLVHQWFVEMLRRFNMWFNIFDEERCAALDESAPDGNPFLDDQLIICSTSFLASSEKRARQVLSATWDMLVVDEAHHLDWSIDKVSPEYGIVELLSKVAKGLLLLTATPEQLGLESHFARLRLLDPDRYSNFETFKSESQDHKEIADLVEHLSSGTVLNKTEKTLLASLFGKQRLALLAKGGEEAKDNLIEDLLDQHGPGRVIFRNTRSAMSGFPKRKAHLIPLNPAKDQELWLQRLSKEFSFDIGTTHLKRQQFWFDEDPRLDWLVALMEQLDPAKVLLICRTKEKVLALDKALSQRVSMNVGVFHEDLNLIQRDRNAAWFAEAEGARLLLCSEIGSEGRNFQFAHHLVLFDLPFHPELLEQRIGRLDRIGQTEEIKIHVPYLSGSPQERLARWFHEGLNAFEENQEGGNQITHLFKDRLLETVNSSTKVNKPFEALIADTAAFQKELKETFANGRDRLLEMNSFRPQIAEKLIGQISSADSDMSLENYMMGVFEHFSVDIEDLAPRTYILQAPRQNAEAFPSIPDEGISITFDRTRALSREDISFISWDHPMVTGALDLVLSLGTGGASFGVLKGSGSPAILLEALFVLETVGGQDIHVDRFLPSTPLRIVVDHTGDDVTDLYPVERLEEQLITASMEDLLQNETLMETIMPNMIRSAKAFAEALSTQEISNGLQRMRLSLDHEINRLSSLHKKNNHIRPEEIQTAVAEQASLATLISEARIRLDAVQLIKKGPM
ncbi:MAG: RNA polymerase-associated protein RapA [Bacteroidia bacterium]